MIKRQYPKSLNSSIGKADHPNHSLGNAISKVLPQMSKDMDRYRSNEYYLVDKKLLTNVFQDNEIQKEMELDLKQEQQTIVSLNNWTYQGPKNYKRQTFSQQSLTKLTSQIRVIDEDRLENNQLRSPRINTKLIHSLCVSDEQVHEYEQSQRNEQKLQDEQTKNTRKFSQLNLLQKLNLVEEFRQKGTQEFQRRQINKSLVNKILFNKMSKALVDQTQCTIATSEVLNSFKSLTTMFKTVYQLLNYNEIMDQIILQKKAPNKIITLSKEFDKDLERQQKNFNDIVIGKLRIIEDQVQKVKQKKIFLMELRVENCRLRDKIANIFERVDEINRDFSQGIQPKGIGEMNYSEKNKLMQKLTKKKDQDMQNQIEQMTVSNEDLKTNSSKIELEEIQFKEMGDIKNHSRSELSEFLKTILKNEDIQIQDSLICIVNFLSQIKTNISIADFPNYLDIHSRNYLLNKSQAQQELEDLKRVNKVLSNTSSKQKISIGQCNRSFHINKLKDVQLAFKQMKKQHSQINGLLQLQDQQEEQCTFTTFDPIKESNEQIILESKTKQSELEKYIDKLENNETNRLKILYQAKQQVMSQIQRLIKTVQANFGAKNMNKILQSILNDNQQQQAQQVLNSYKIKENNQIINIRGQSISENPKSYYYKYNQQRIREDIQNKPKINSDYDTTYNNMPTLQNKYSNSTYFPKGFAISD